MKKNDISQEKKDIIVLHWLIEKYKVPFFLTDFIWILEHDDQQSMQILRYVCALRIIHNLMEIADEQKTKTQTDFERYLQLIRIYYSWCDCKRVKKKVSMTGPRSKKDKLLLAEQDFQVSLTYIDEQEYQLLKHTHDFEKVTRQLFGQTNQALVEEGPYFMAFIERMFPEIIGQVKELMQQEK